MRKHYTAVLALILAVALHVDWHLARPLHHRLSLAWPYHWVATALVFAIVGCLIARIWATERWGPAALAFVAAIVLAQVVEPVGEMIVYHGRLAYPDDPGRLDVFAQTIIASSIAFWSTVWACAPDAPANHTPGVA